MKDKALFVEKQFVGLNIYWITRRLAFVVFCSAFYFWSKKNNDSTADLFLIMTFFIIIASIVLTFTVYYKITVFNGSIVIDGLLSTRKVKIDFSSIKSIKKSKYSSFLLNNPVYNLHKKGVIRFFAKGSQAIRIKDRDGLVYIIGSRQSDNIIKIISDKISES